MKTHQLIHLGASVVAIALFASPASASPGKGNGKEKGNSNKGNAQKVEKHFDKEHKKAAKSWKSYNQLEKNDRDLITSLFRTPTGATQLPPGLAKNLQRGKPLPPGWQKKLVPGARLDDDLFGSFLEVPPHLIPGFKAIPDTRLYYHENRIVRLLDATREIIDVIDL